jgi:hypothetical protein
MFSRRRCLLLLVDSLPRILLPPPAPAERRTVKSNIGVKLAAFFNKK